MNLKDFIRSIPNYPKKGILFRDITTLIKNEKAFCECIEQIVEKSKKFQSKSIKKNQELGQTKNSAKLVLFIFGIGPIIGITIFLFTKGFFNSPNF